MIRLLANIARRIRALFALELKLDHHLVDTIVELRAQLQVERTDALVKHRELEAQLAKERHEHKYARCLLEIARLDVSRLEREIEPLRVLRVELADVEREIAEAMARATSRGVA